METEDHSVPLDDAAADTAFFARRRCCCFWVPWSSRRVPDAAAASSSDEWWERIHVTGSRDPSAAAGGGAVGGGAVGEGRWWRRGVQALMKIREWSELVAGPRWKTFIRRFGRTPRNFAAGGGGGGGGGRFGRRLNYDPLSYALNFDEGHGASPEGDYTGYRDFSSRFAAPPMSAKSSMDLGGRDAPPLFPPPAAPAPAGVGGR